MICDVCDLVENDGESVFSREKCGFYTKFFSDVIIGVQLERIIKALVSSSSSSRC